MAYRDPFTPVPNAAALAEVERRKQAVRMQREPKPFDPMNATVAQARPRADNATMAAYNQTPGRFTAAAERRPQFVTERATRPPTGAGAFEQPTQSATVTGFTTKAAPRPMPTPGWAPLTNPTHLLDERQARPATTPKPAMPRMSVQERADEAYGNAMFGLRPSLVARTNKQSARNTYNVSTTFADTDGDGVEEKIETRTPKSFSLRGGQGMGKNVIHRDMDSDEAYARSKLDAKAAADARVAARTAADTSAATAGSGPARSESGRPLGMGRMVNGVATFSDGSGNVPRTLTSRDMSAIAAGLPNTYGGGNSTEIALDLSNGARRMNPAAQAFMERTPALGGGAYNPSAATIIPRGEDTASTTYAGGGRNEAPRFRMPRDKGFDWSAANDFRSSENQALASFRSAMGNKMTPSERQAYAAALNSSVGAENARANDAQKFGFDFALGDQRESAANYRSDTSNMTDLTKTGMNNETDMSTTLLRELGADSRLSRQLDAPESVTDVYGNLLRRQGDKVSVVRGKNGDPVIMPIEAGGGRSSGRGGRGGRGGVSRLDVNDFQGGKDWRDAAIANTLYSAAAGGVPTDDPNTMAGDQFIAQDLAGAVNRNGAYTPNWLVQAWLGDNAWNQGYSPMGIHPENVEAHYGMQPGSPIDILDYLVFGVIPNNSVATYKDKTTGKESSLFTPSLPANLRPEVVNTLGAQYVNNQRDRDLRGDRKRMTRYEDTK